MDEELWALGGLILLGMAIQERSIQWGDGWQWPVPDLLNLSAPAAEQRTPAVISQEFRGKGGAQRPHYGVDIMYRSRRPPPTFSAPQGAPILAAKAGTLWSVQRTARGWAVVLDHGPPWATFYQHLETVDPELEHGVQGVSRRPPGALATPVFAGFKLGTMGSDPLDGGHVRHLHFATWYRGAGDSAAVDPATAMESWPRVELPWIT